MIKPSKIFEIYVAEKSRVSRNKTSHRNSRFNNGMSNAIILTKNLTPNNRFFNEKILRENNIEYREFDPRRSKLAALILKGCMNIFIRKGNVILYLGASHGYTTSYISDIIGNDGFIFAIDSSPTVVRDLYFLAKIRKNIAPILADGNTPKEYIQNVCLADIVYQDIAQKNQAEIFLKNIRLFLKKGGYALLVVKARSINVIKKPSELFKEVRKKLEKELTIIDYKTLEPYQKDHCMFICKAKN